MKAMAEFFQFHSRSENRVYMAKRWWSLWSDLWNLPGGNKSLWWRLQRKLMWRTESKKMLLAKWVFVF